MSGIYGIKINNCLVYIGKAKDINSRVRQHLNQILGTPTANKYWLLKDALSRCSLSFWLLEETQDDLDKAEQKWIKALQPCLNTQFMGGGTTGHGLTANEFYQIVFNETHEIQNAVKWQYRKGETKYGKLH